MTKRFLTAAVVFLLLPALQGCLINNREWETLKEQVRQNQKGLADLQKRQEEHAVRLEGVDNSIQMLETRVDERSDRLESLAARMDAASLPGGSIVVPSLPAIAPPPGPVPGTAGAAEPGPPHVDMPAVVDAPAAEPVPLSYAPRTYASGDDLYNSAYRHFEKGEYGQAILEFEEYVANYGSTELADNAQYWIGECYYAQKDFRQAMREFEKVERNFPRGNKVPAAKLKKGMGYQELGQRDEAARELREVVARFADSEEALLAREKLKVLK